MSPTYEAPEVKVDTTDAAGGWVIPQPGDIVAEKYRVEDVIGQGGLAVVLRAYHLQLEEPVALKVLSPAWAGSAEVMHRFLDEGRAATRIKSEHVVRIRDVGTLPGGAPFIVMEYLHGHDLDAVIRTHGKLPVGHAIGYVLQAGEAIAEAHAFGIVHRDLKPANLFLTERSDGTACVKVLDFGISKRTDPSHEPSRRLTAPNAVMGSPHYMSPEQILTPHEVDTRCDIWALGAILYELLAGKPAFDRPTFPELYHAVVAGEPQPLSEIRSDVSPVLEAVIRRCLMKKPADRFQSVAELAVALEALAPELGSLSAERILRLMQGSQPDGGPRTSGGVVVSNRPRAIDTLEGTKAPKRRSRGLLMVVTSVAILSAAGFVSHRYYDRVQPYLGRLAAAAATPPEAPPASVLPDRKIAEVPPPPPAESAAAIVAAAEAQSAHREAAVTIPTVVHPRSKALFVEPSAAPSPPPAESAAAKADENPYPTEPVAAPGRKDRARKGRVTPAPAPTGDDVLAPRAPVETKPAPERAPADPKAKSSPPDEPFFAPPSFDLPVPPTPGPTASPSSESSKSLFDERK